MYLFGFLNLRDVVHKSFSQKLKGEKVAIIIATQSVNFSLASFFL